MNILQPMAIIRMRLVAFLTFLSACGAGQVPSGDSGNLDTGTHNADCPTGTTGYGIDSPVSFAEWSVEDVLGSIEKIGYCSWNETGERFTVRASALDSAPSVTEVQRYDPYFEYCRQNAAFSYRLELVGSTFEEDLSVPGEIISTPYEPYMTTIVDIESEALPPGEGSIGVDSPLVVYGLEINEYGEVQQVMIELHMRNDVVLTSACAEQ